MIDPFRRFSNRVAAYAQHRPDYPVKIVDLLKTECGLEPGAVVADIGSGTGRLAKLFLAAGFTVIGVEPDPKMRQAATQFLKEYPRFKSVAGQAEDTHLAKRSVDLVTAAQAFHWFNPDQTRREFGRILIPMGWVMLAWNVMRTTTTAFQRAYHDLLLTYGADYDAIRKSHANQEAIGQFFEPARFNIQTYANRQNLDYAGLEGRLLSSSFTPQSGQSRHKQMLQALKAIFEEHQQQGKVTLEYDTKVFYGRIHAQGG